MTVGRRRLTISSVVRSSASLRLSSPGLLAIAVAAIALVLVDAFASSAWFVTSIAAITAIETVLFVTWLTARPNNLGEFVRFGAWRVFWIGALALLRSVLGGAAIILVGLLAVLLAGGATPELILYLGSLGLVAAAVLACAGRLLCAGPIVVAHDVSAPSAMRRSWLATMGSVAPAATLSFGVYVLSFGLQGYLGLFGVVGLVLAIVIGAVVAAAVQAGAYGELFSA